MILILAVLTFWLLVIVAKQRDTIGLLHEHEQDSQEVVNILRHQLIHVNEARNDLSAMVDSIVYDYNSLEQDYTSLLDYAQQALSDRITEYVRNEQAYFDDIDSIVYDDYKHLLAETIINEQTYLQSYCKKWNKHTVPSTVAELLNSPYITFSIGEQYGMHNPTDNLAYDSVIIGEIDMSIPEFIQDAPQNVLDGLHSLPCWLYDDNENMSIQIGKVLNVHFVTPSHCVRTTADNTDASFDSYFYNQQQALEFIRTVVKNKPILISNERGATYIRDNGNKVYLTIEHVLA